MKKYFLVLLFYLMATSVQAATRYVDKDNSCPGDGSTGNPYCTIAGAVAVANAGDVIRIRDAASAYSEVVETSRSGASGNPIIVEPDVGHNPTLRNAGNGATGATFWLHGSYWTIRNLNFDATGVSPTTHGAILVHTTAGNIYDITISGNTFTAWGGSESFPSRGASAVTISGGTCADPANDPCAWPINVVIDSNTFTNNRLIAITLGHSDGTIVRNNTITGQKCGLDGDAVNKLGIKAHYNNKNVLIEGNSIHDFDAFANCTIPNQGHSTAAGYWCDVGSYPNSPQIFRRNKIYNIDATKTNQTNSNGLSYTASGIFVEADCHSYSVTNNLIYNIGFMAIRNRQDTWYVGRENKFYNNAIYGAYIGYWTENAGGTEFKNNILWNLGNQVLHLHNVTHANHVINYNIYSQTGALYGDSDSGGFLNFTNWKTHCGCDANSLTSDPLFISTTGGSENFALQSTSPAINAGVNVGYSYNGSAPDIGAFETMAFTSAEVGTINATTAVLTFENNLAPPLLPSSSCTGFSVEENTGGGFGAVTVNSCNRSGTNLVALGLGTSITSGSTVRFSYSPGNVTDSMLIGNAAVQRLNALTNQSITNNVGASPAYNFAATAFRIYGLRTNSGTLSILPHAAAAINTNASVVPGAMFNVAIQTDCTAADCPSAGQLLYYSKNGGSYTAVPTSFDADNIKMFGLTDSSTDIQSEGTAISSCLNGALTPATGLVVRTSNAIPTFDMVQNGCVVNRWIVQLDTDVSPGDTYDFRPYDQAGTAINTYSVTPRVTVIGDRAAGGGA